MVDDQTAYLQRLIDQTPNGTTSNPAEVTLPAGTFRVDGTLIVKDREWLVINAAGCVMQRTVIGVENSRHIDISGSRYIEWHGGRVQGVHTAYDDQGIHGLYRTEYESQHAMSIGPYGSTTTVHGECEDVLIEDFECRDVGGDGVYVHGTNYGPQTARVRIEPSNVTIRRALIEKVGRQGIGVVGVRGLVIEDCTIMAKRTGIDLENVLSGVIDDVIIRRNAISSRNGFVNGQSSNPNCNNILIEDNAVVGAALRCTGRSTKHRTNWKVLRNIWPGPTTYPQDINRERIWFIHTDNVEVRDNYLRSGLVSTHNRQQNAALLLSGVDGIDIAGNDFRGENQLWHLDNKWDQPVTNLCESDNVGIWEGPISGFQEYPPEYDPNVDRQWSPADFPQLFPTPFATEGHWDSLPRGSGLPINSSVQVAFPVRQQVSRFLTGSSISATLRVAPIEDSVVFVALSAATTLANMTGPAGFTKAAESQGVGVAVQLWYKRAGASESSTITCTSSVSAALKLHVWEMSGGLFADGDPLSVVASNNSGSSAVTTLNTGAAVTDQADVLAVAAVAALGGKGDFRLINWSDGFTALTDHETEGLMLGFNLLTEEQTLSTSATWNHATAPTSMKAAGLLATFNLAGPVTLREPNPRRVSAGTKRAQLNTTGTVDTLATFPLTAGHQYLCFVGTSKQSGVGGDSTMPPSHGGQAWSLIQSHSIGRARRVHLFEARPTVDAPAASVVITTPLTGVAIWWLVLEVTGPNTLHQIAVGQEPVGARFIEASFTNVPDPDSAVVGLCMHGQPEPQLPDVDPDIHLLYSAAKIADQGQWASVQWFGGSDQTLRWDWASSIHGLVVMVEVGS